MAIIPTIFLTSVVLAKVAAGADVTFPCTIPRDARVSLAVYDKDERMVRTLLTGKSLAKGRHTASWDGLNRYGNALPAGEYTWKLLATEGLRAEFITQVGQHPNPVWEKGVCNHEPPMAAAVDTTGVYRLGIYDENAHAGVRTDLEGRYQWSTDHRQAEPWCQFGAALTVVGEQLYMLVFNGTVDRFDTVSGRCLTSDKGVGLWNVSWEGGPIKIQGK